MDRIPPDGEGYASLSNTHESLVFFSWSSAIFYLALEYSYKNWFLGAFAVASGFEVLYLLKS